MSKWAAHGHQASELASWVRNAENNAKSMPRGVLRNALEDVIEANRRRANSHARKRDKMSDQLLQLVRAGVFDTKNAKKLVQNFTNSHPASK